MGDALILIDLQNEYFTGGNRELVNPDRAVKNAAKLLSAFRAKNKPVFHIQHLAPWEGSEAFLPDTNGVEFHISVKPYSDEKIIQKYYPNGFRKTTLLDELKAIKAENITICGAMSHMCVEATTRAAADFEFKNTVVEDACATKDLSFNGEIIPADSAHKAFMAALSPFYAQVKGTDDVIKKLE